MVEIFLLLQRAIELGKRESKVWNAGATTFLTCFMLIFRIAQYIEVPFQIMVSRSARFYVNSQWLYFGKPSEVLERGCAKYIDCNIG